MNNGNGIPMPQVQYPSALDIEYQKSWLRVHEAEAKADINFRKQDELDCRRVVRREQIREYRETLYDEICVDINGNISCVKKNSMFTLGSRWVFNITNPCLTNLISSEGDEGVTEFCFRLSDGSTREVFFDQKKLSDGKYLLKKLRNVGVEVYINKETKAEQMTCQLMTKLIKTAGTKIEPAHEGWNNVNGEFIYRDKGARTWKQIIQLIK